MAKQKRIPGTEDMAIPELDEKIDEYRKAVAGLTKYREKKKVAGDALVEAMHNHGQTEYVNGDYKAVIGERETLKVEVIDREEENLNESEE